MTVAEPEDTGKADLSVRLLDALGESNWRMRQVAVDRLASHGSPLLIAQVVEIVRVGHRNLSRLNAAIQVLTRTECDVVPALLSLLGDADYDTRAYAALTLGERGDVRAIPALVAALADPNTNVRVHAIEALGKLRAAAAVDALIEFVDQLDFELAFPALDALVAIGDERIAHRLLPLLHNPLLKTAAIEALGTLGDEEAVVSLLKLLGDSSVSPATIATAVQKIHDRHAARYGSGGAVAEIVRQTATRASVSALRSSILFSSPAETVAIVAILGWLPVEEAEATLLDLLDNPTVRIPCLNALATKGPAIIPAVLERFDRSPRESQLSLIEMCGRVADKRATPLLLECLRKDDEEAIAKALDALARIGDERMYARCKQFLGHPSLRIRQAAVNALNSLGHPETASDLLQLLRDPDPLVCESALKVAAYFGFPNCIDSMLACCDHPDEHVRRTAIEHLPCLDDERIASFLESALQSDIASLRTAAAGALGEINASIAIPLLRKALNDSDVWVRYFAVRSVARFDYDTKMMEQLVRLADFDSAMQVRIAAIEALKPDALPALIEFAGSTEDDVAIAAVKALGATGCPLALPTLLLAARSPHTRKSAEAIRALGESGLKGAIEPLREAALGRDPSVADDAISALGRIPLPESVVALLAVMDSPSKRPLATVALMKLGEAVVPALACRLHLLELDVRRAVIEVLIGIRCCEAIEVLETLMADAEPAVRLSALSALARMRRIGRQTSEAVGSEGDT